MREKHGNISTDHAYHLHRNYRNHIYQQKGEIIMAVANSLVKKTQKAGITTFLNSMNVVSNIDQALGKDNRQRFITGVISAVNNNAA